jgi:DNA-binding helix-hairpin-helix protein with protein kinase domain
MTRNDTQPEHSPLRNEAAIRFTRVTNGYNNIRHVLYYQDGVNQPVAVNSARSTAAVAEASIAASSSTQPEAKANLEPIDETFVSQQPANLTQETISHQNITGQPIITSEAYSAADQQAAIDKTLAKFSDVLGAEERA